MFFVCPLGPNTCFTYSSKMKPGVNHVLFLSSGFKYLLYKWSWPDNVLFQRYSLLFLAKRRDAHLMSLPAALKNKLSKLYVFLCRLRFQSFYLAFSAAAQKRQEGLHVRCLSAGSNYLQYRDYIFRSTSYLYFCSEESPMDECLPLPLEMLYDRELFTLPFPPLLKRITWNHMFFIYPLDLNLYSTEILSFQRYYISISVQKQIQAEVCLSLPPKILYNRIFVTFSLFAASQKEKHGKSHVLFLFFRSIYHPHELDLFDIFPRSHRSLYNPHELDLFDIFPRSHILSLLKSHAGDSMSLSAPRALHML
jgi:hypothetical protein